MAKNKKQEAEGRQSTGLMADQFEIVSGKVRVTDPCYDEKTWCSAGVDNVKNGVWNAFVVMKNEREWGTRCAELQVWHSDYRKDDVVTHTMEYIKADIGVDSGQAGVFDSKFFKDPKSVAGVERTYNGARLCEDEPWYSMCCDRTLGEKMWGTIPYGAVSRSGFGDGGYNAYLTKKDGKVVAIKIVFIGDDEGADEEVTEY